MMPSFVHMVAMGVNQTLSLTIFSRWNEMNKMSWKHGTIRQLRNLFAKLAYSHTHTHTHMHKYIIWRGFLYSESIGNWSNQQKDFEVNELCVYSTLLLSSDIPLYHIFFFLSLVMQNLFLKVDGSWVIKFLHLLCLFIQFSWLKPIIKTQDPKRCSPPCSRSFAVLVLAFLRT